MENQTKALTGKIVQIQKSIGSLEEEAQVIKIKNTGDLNYAVEFLKKIKGWKKRVEEIRLSYTKPLNDIIRERNKEFKQTSLPLAMIEKKVTNEIEGWRAKEAEKIRIKQEKEAERQRKIFEKEQEEKRKQLLKDQEEMSKKEAKEKAKEIEQEEFVAKPTIIQDKEIGEGEATMKTRKRWDFEIEDETKVPRKYMKVDEIAIGKAVRGGDVREIKGVKIFQKESFI